MLEKLLLSYLNKQKKDALLYCTLAIGAGYSVLKFEKAFVLVWKALMWVLKNGTPTLAAVKRDLKMT